MPRDGRTPAIESTGPRSARRRLTRTLRCWAVTFLAVHVGQRTRRRPCCRLGPWDVSVPFGAGTTSLDRARGGCRRPVPASGLTGALRVQPAWLSSERRAGRITDRLDAGGLGPATADHMAGSAELAAEAKKARADSAAEVRAAARALHDQGISMRDAAVLLGVSHQRVHQLIRAPDLMASGRRRRPTLLRGHQPQCPASTLSGSRRCSPGWTRTNNRPINSRMLCQLSYGGPSRPLARYAA